MRGREEAGLEWTEEKRCAPSQRLQSYLPRSISNVSAERSGSGIVSRFLPAPMLNFQQESPAPFSREKSSCAHCSAKGDPGGSDCTTQQSEAPKWSIVWWRCIEKTLRCSC